MTGQPERPSDSHNGLLDCASGLAPELEAELRSLDIRLLAAIASAHGESVRSTDLDAFRGLYLRRGDVEREFVRPAGGWWTDGRRGAEVDEPPGSLRTSGQLSGAASAAGLPWLCGYFQLNRFERAVVVLGLAPEIDSRYAKAYAYLQDDAGRTQPTVELALRLLCTTATERLEHRERLGAAGTLVRNEIVRVEPATSDHELSAALQVDPIYVRLLLGTDGLDLRLRNRLRWAPAPRLAWAADILWTPLLEGLVREARAEPRLLLQLVGSPGSGRGAVASRLAGLSGRRALLLDLNGASASSGVGPTDPRMLLRLGLRQAWASRALLIVRGLMAADSLGTTNGGMVPSWLADELAEHAAQVALILPRPWRPPPGRLPRLVTVDLSATSASDRERLWADALLHEGADVAATSVRDLADRFRFNAGQIADIAATVARPAGESVPQLGNGELASRLFAHARRMGGDALERHARRIRPAHSWEDLVLPDDPIEQLRDLRDRAAHRRTVLEDWGFGAKGTRGLAATALFTGPSGTGKTLAAEVVAGSLGVDLFAIDLASVLSKYIGEVEQNLDRVFAAAETANGVLFFDEADALFGKRSEVHDAHDRYANIEVSYLLQKMEEYEGVAILATNLRDNLDDAFLRRIAFSVHFPFPDLGSRRRIWKRVWPPDAPLDPSISVEQLAELPLSGGNIRNVAVAAAHLAASRQRTIDGHSIAAAVRRELQKLGKRTDEADVLALLSTAAQTAPAPAA